MAVGDVITINNKYLLPFTVTIYLNIFSGPRNENGWWQGELNGKVGMFPSNYVEELKTGEGTICVVLVVHCPRADVDLCWSKFIGVWTVNKSGSLANGAGMGARSGTVVSSGAASSFYNLPKLSNLQLLSIA